MPTLLHISFGIIDPSTAETAAKNSSAFCSGRETEDVGGGPRAQNRLFWRKGLRVRLSGTTKET